MKRRAVILSIVVVLSMMVAGVGASATTVSEPAQQAPVPAQQTTPQTNDSDTTDEQTVGQPAPPELGEPPYPIDIPPSQLANGSVDTSTLPANVQSNGEYSVQTNVGYVTKSKTDAERRPAPEYEVGGPQLLWPSLDNTAQSGPENNSAYYFKNYTLRVVSPSVEIWVANDLSFPEGDPRPTPNITQAQLLYLADEYTNNIEPKESQLYRDPVGQYGTDSPLYPPPSVENGSLPDDYYQSGDNQSRTVLLVDNVRDQNYYNPDFPTYIAGFFSPTIGTFTDRNVMVIDSNGWNQRLGPESAPWQEPGAEGENFGIESTTAHEYQHLLHSYEDPDETSWINEGISEVTPYRVGYGLPNSIAFYERYPSNSLIEWRDQEAIAPITVLADYGVAGLFQLYGSQQFGTEFTQDVFSDDANGIQSVKNTLNDVGAERDFYSFYQDFSTALLVDDLDTTNERYQIENLTFDANTSEVIYTRNNLTAAYGNAYEPLNPESGSVDDLNVSGIDFRGTPWTTVSDPPGEPSDEALYSTSGNNLDNNAIFSVDPTSSSTLTFDTYYDIERGWDYGFVQVSTDGGETWTSLSNENTTNETAQPQIDPDVQENLPGFTGDTNGSWVTEEFDLSNYADDGEVLISFRYITDVAAVQPGWYVDDISVSGTDISYDGSSTEPFESLREARENPFRYQFSVLGIREDGTTEVTQYGPRTFEDANSTSLEQLPSGEFNRTILTATWAPETTATGTVPYGYEVNPAEQPEDGANTLTIMGADGNTNYGFSVTGDVGENYGVDQQFADEIGEKTGSGVVGRATDSYTFTGELVRLEVNGDATVLLNGEEIDPADYPDDILRISGVDGNVNYEFAANSGVSEAYGVDQQFRDRIEGNSGSGLAGSGEDAYAFSGDLTRLAVSGQAEIYLNGVRIDPDEYPDNIITISGMGETASYEFSASGDVGENYGVEQQFRDRIEGNSGSGIVGPGEDSYTFDGNLRSLNVNGNAVVTVNGEEVDESEA